MEEQLVKEKECFTGNTVDKKEKKCSTCRAIHFRNSRLCLTCHAAYMRDFRKKRKLTERQRKKDKCRSYSSVCKRRGKLKQEPCEACGNPDSEMHHDDYDKPLEVRWFCRECHLEYHKKMDNNAN